MGVTFCLLFSSPCFSVKPPHYWSLGRCVPKLAVLSSAPVGYFFFPLVFQRKRVIPFSKVRVFPISQRSSEGGGDALSQGFCLHWDCRCEIWIGSLKCLESLCLDKACCPCHMLSWCGLKPRVLSVC